MPRTLTQKIIDEHLVQGVFASGQEIALTIDQTLTQDATGTLAALEFEALGLERVRTELSVSYVDHNILQADFKNPDDHRFLRSFAARYGLWYSPPGNGICHQLHLLHFGRPGATLLGSDSHTPHGGGLGMLAMGAGGLDVAAAMAGAPFSLPCPKVLGVELTGRLSPWVGAKDVILELLKRLSVKGGVGYVLEYFGPDVATLSVYERAAITNMGAELGATTSIFPSDDNTRAFLADQDRAEVYQPLTADQGCAYDAVERIDLEALEPLAACPSSPDAVRPVSELGGVAVEQVLVGSCGGGSYHDLMILAGALKGKKLAPGVTLGINPGARQALAQIAANGALNDLLEAGVRLHQSGCLGCIGMSQAPATGVASLRTFPRNFPGRSGTKDDQVYLSGPQVAAATALAGHLADPRELGPAPQVPPAPPLHPSALAAPLDDGSGVEVLRGPNIAPFPELDALPEDLSCTVTLKVGDNITTDHIMPAGSQILPLRSNVPAISQFVFADLDEGFATRTQTAAPAVVVGGENYGQGSSREHAALGPRYLGVRAKIVKSFARIHKANLVNFGVVPLVLADPEDYERLDEGQLIQLPGLKKALLGGAEEFEALVDGQPLKLIIQASPREREILALGGRLNYIKSRL
ncbi:MAG: aconitate hydratase [Desulfarculaceae bacterium]|nr:aconitate hydratase [Desulfarculaceae bacterium]MCF8072198.1 aconitate hydratase [Desulfarculaceae bacterium]MCF8100119.1 aconitate hydratase [Desulfarculaceae bacterium]MCF8117232.1 aconitate hydratase [Desulfarculaceae bacterium]